MERPPEHLSTRWNPPSAPLRVAPRRSAQLRAGSRQLGIERLLRASWAGEKWEEVRGGERAKEGGGRGWRGTLGNKGISENKRQEETRAEGSGGGSGALLLRVGFVLFLVLFSPNYFCSAKANRCGFPRASLPRSVFFFLFSYKAANKQANTEGF